jgi:hypothetical protein
MAGRGRVTVTNAAKTDECRPRVHWNYFVQSMTSEQIAVLGLYAKFAARHGRPPTIAEIAGYLGRSPAEICECLAPLVQTGFLVLQPRADGQSVYVGNITLDDFDWVPKAASPLPSDRTMLQSLLRRVDTVIETSESGHSRFLARIDALRHGLDGNEQVAFQALDQLTVLDLVHNRDDSDPGAELLKYVDVRIFREALLDLELACHILRSRRPNDVCLRSCEELDCFVAERMQAILDACGRIRAVYRELRAEIAERLSEPDDADDAPMQMSVPQMAAYIWGEEYAAQPKKGEDSRDCKHRLLRLWIANGRLKATKSETKGVYRISLELLKALREPGN